MRDNLRGAAGRWARDTLAVTAVVLAVGGTSLPFRPARLRTERPAARESGRRSHGILAFSAAAPGAGARQETGLHPPHAAGGSTATTEGRRPKR